MIWKVVETTDGWIIDGNVCIPKTKKPYKSTLRHIRWLYDFYLDLKSFYDMKGELK